MAIPEAHKKVPMMFRAQANGRCQLQLLKDKQGSIDPRQDSERWVDEWIERVYPEPPEFGEGVRSRKYDLSWRFVTNDGQDDSIIRPVIGARGWPFYPGSSMKGIFRKACSEEQALKYCGTPPKHRNAEEQESQEEELIPGCLRFHGGYPVDDSWYKGKPTENQEDEPKPKLLDIIHPQQERQVKHEKTTSAFAQISLYKPRLKFGISSDKDLPPEEWETVWKIWEKAMAMGLGCRVSSGYGQVADTAGDLLCEFQLRGQGQAAKLINGEGEFRPNVFRAAIRGHALRVFGGLTDANSAELLVDQLFGSIKGSGDVGLLSMAFEGPEPVIETYGSGAYAQPTYDAEGKLRWLLTDASLPVDQREALRALVLKLMQFAMLLGGFGKSWRRADHRLFYPDYYDYGNKPLIGCQWEWQWTTPRELMGYHTVRKIEHVTPFLADVQKKARDWIAVQNRVKLGNGWARDWREAWHPRKVQVWGRIAEEQEASEAIHWLHGPYQQADRTIRRSEQSIYQTQVTGKLGQIGRLWHRMYPWLRILKDPNDPSQPKVSKTRKFFELLTLFPDGSREMDDFLDFLSQNPYGFRQYWGGE